MFLTLYLTLKPYVVGTQKNCLIETILLSTHNIGFAWIIREILRGKQLFTPPYMDPCIYVILRVYRHVYTFAKDHFWKHCDKERNS